MFIVKAQEGSSNGAARSSSGTDNLNLLTTNSTQEHGDSCLPCPVDVIPASVNGYYSRGGHDYKDEDYKDDRPAYVNGFRRHEEHKESGQLKDKNYQDTIKAQDAPNENLPAPKWEHVEKWNWVCCHSRDIAEAKPRHKFLLSKSITDCPVCGHEICHNCHKPLVYLLEPEPNPTPTFIYSGNSFRVNSNGEIVGGTGTDISGLMARSNF